MRRIFTVFLTICLLVSSVPLAASAENNEKVSPVIDERVINILEQNNIDYQIQDGTLKLSEITPEAIATVNKLLNSEFKTESKNSLAATYPTPYTHMKNYDIYTSEKFQAATKTALGAAVVEWAKGKFIPDPWKISIAAIGGFGVYYFVTSNKENLFISIKYYYRALGPGFFTENGNFIGDYEILKEIRVTANSNHTGGNIEHDARKSSVVEPWF
ncbi:MULTISPECIES: hypothetical protein [Paenibacillus]|uniref:Uncharacterized protein n=1 Tax=Paenibacillus cucumis (ex Kampfer et al. 2016) TaxID=1776858 RepID=A0ABS7KIE8_9BACL|nr:hypothetical protein [Paenibacillus cucumis (ex Kampfer et al. 2016)]MBY0203741.1 hypothetical protein [Paenibacillus cucumis (ex Kampfer et al. 2016)]MDP9702115.1 hypothetical protein [Paenibacillus intestini]